MLRKKNIISVFYYPAFIEFWSTIIRENKLSKTQLHNYCCNKASKQLYDWSVKRSKSKPIIIKRRFHPSLASKTQNCNDE